MIFLIEDFGVFKQDFKDLARLMLTENCQSINALLIFSKDDFEYGLALETFYKVANLTQNSKDKQLTHYNFFLLDMYVRFLLYVVNFSH